MHVGVLRSSSCGLVRALGIRPASPAGRDKVYNACEKLD